MSCFVILQQQVNCKHSFVQQSNVFLRQGHFLNVTKILSFLFDNYEGHFS